MPLNTTLVTLEVWTAMQTAMERRKPWTLCKAWRALTLLGQSQRDQSDFSCSTHFERGAWSRNMQSRSVHSTEVLHNPVRETGRMMICAGSSWSCGPRRNELQCVKRAAEVLILLWTPP